MDLAAHPYYSAMLQKGRMIPFFHKDKLICFITFYIDDDINKYINSDHWELFEDNPNGKNLYITQLWTDETSYRENHKLAYEVWQRIKTYIKGNFPSVKTIYWRRHKNFIVKTYKKEIE